MFAPDAHKPVSTCPDWLDEAKALLLPTMHPILNAVDVLRHLPPPSTRLAYPGWLALFMNPAMALDHFFLWIVAAVQGDIQTLFLQVTGPLR